MRAAQVREVRSWRRAREPLSWRASSPRTTLATNAMRFPLLATLGLALAACRSSAPAETSSAKPEIRYYEIADT